MRWRPFTVLCWLSAAIMLAIGIYATAYTNGHFYVLVTGRWTWTFGNGLLMASRDNRIVGSMPIHLIAIPFSLPALAWAIIACGREQRRKLIVAGRCAACGYDLRASTERCPECGTPIKVPA